MGVAKDVQKGVMKGTNVKFVLGVLAASLILTFTVSFYVSQGWPGSSFLQNNTPFA